MHDVEVLTSRSNPWFKRLRAQVEDNSLYKHSGLVWLEGDHLLKASVEQGMKVECLVVAQSAWPQWQRLAQQVTAHSPGQLRLVSDALFQSLTSLNTPTGIGALVSCPPTPPIGAHWPTLVLDQIQDVGNLGSILRTAAAFGIVQVLGLPGCASFWSTKALRAAMGAHFALHLHESVSVPELQLIRDLPWLATSLDDSATALNAHTRLPWPCVWFFGHEGQGLSADLLAQCDLRLKIPQPGGQESLNVACAAAICLYASNQSRGEPPL